MAMCSKTTSLLFTIVIMPTILHALTISEIRQIRDENRLSCLLVLGDSSVDPGNNNYLATSFKSNFPPYGVDFIDRRPTGRFTDGRLATDFIAETLGLATEVRAFLNPNLTKEDLLHGVSFASAGSGYDDLTANFSSVLSLERQLNYLMHYKVHLRQLIGYKKADEFIRKAVFVLSMGTNDYLQNYYLEPIRPRQFTLDQYHDYLVSRMRHAIQVMHNVGARKIVVVGVPPIGCMPVVITLVGDGSNCVDKFNKAVLSLNAKLHTQLDVLHTKLNMNTLYVDAYGSIESAIQNPKKYGFKETRKGCCGTGTYEMGDACKGLNVCKNPKEYIFWDAVHPSQKMYEIIADLVVKAIPYNFTM